MPTYEYECAQCGHHFEVFQSMRAARLKTCPKCNGKVKRLLGSGAGIIFKGSGFYQTDYRRSSGAPSAGEKSSSGKKSEKPAEKSAPAAASGDASKK